MGTEQIRRVKDSIQETERVLARALGYSPQFQDARLIGQYRAHLAKLIGMLS